MKKLLITALLFAGISHAAEVNDGKWVNNKHGVPIVVASSHKDRFLMSQDCNGDAVLTFFDFANYNADANGRSITYKLRVDEGEIYAGKSYIQGVDDFYGIRVYPTEEQFMELMKGNTLRVIYKLSDGTYGGMETYTLKGYTSSMLKAPNACTNEAEEYFNLDGDAV